MIKKRDQFKLMHGRLRWKSPIYQYSDRLWGQLRDQLRDQIRDYLKDYLRDQLKYEARTCYRKRIS